MLDWRASRRTLARVDSQRASSLLAPLLLWLLMQLAAMGLCAAGVRLAENFVQPAERAASHAVLVAQLAGPALMVPWLARSWSVVVALLASAIPMTQLAAMLSGTPLTGAAGSLVLVAAWIAALRLWSDVASTPTRAFYVPAIASAWLIGGLALTYAGAESWAVQLDQATGTDAVYGRLIDLYSPLLLGIRMLEGRTAVWQWATVGVLPAIPALIVLARQLSNRFSTARQQMRAS